MFDTGRCGGRVIRAPDCQWRDDGGSVPPVTVSKLGQFCVVGPFYLVSMPGEVKDPTQRVNVYPVVDSWSGGLYL